MQRSISNAVSLTALRTLSTTSSPTPAQTTPPSTATPSSTAAPPPPPPPAVPTPPPPSRGIIRRTLPLTVGATVGFIAYKASTDYDFRKTLIDTFPPSERILHYLPTPPPTQSSPFASSLSKDPEPKILLKMDDSNSNPNSIDSPPTSRHTSSSSTSPSSSAATPPNDSLHNSLNSLSLQSLTPSQRAAAKQHTLPAITAPNPDTPTPSTTPSSPKPPSPSQSKSPTLHKPASAPTTPPPRTPPTPNAPPPPPTTPPQENNAHREATPTPAVGDAGKTRVARLLGKRGYYPEAVTGTGDVIDVTAFQRPAIWSKPPPAAVAPPPSSTAVEDGKKCPVSPHRRSPTAQPAATARADSMGGDGGRRAMIASSEKKSMTGKDKDSKLQKMTAPASKMTAGSLPAPTTAGVAGVDSAADDGGVSTRGMEMVTDETRREIEMLRAELASQTKWEAVRLQEAVRAQMVEDQNAAGKAAALVEEQHRAEVARVKAEHVLDVERAVAKREREVERRMMAEREEAIRREVEVREGELRAGVLAELAEKEGVASGERERRVGEAEAGVRALGERWDAVVAQSGRVREAAKRASGAFLMREVVGGGGEIGRGLAAACSGTELGRLVVGSLKGDGKIASEEGLRKEFVGVARKGLSAAAVPEGMVGWMWAHALGSLFSRMKIGAELTGIGEGGEGEMTDEERIRVAEVLVRRGEIREAVGVLRGVGGLAGEVVGDWVERATGRIVAGMAADVLLADAIIAEVGLTTKE